MNEFTRFVLSLSEAIARNSSPIVGQTLLEPFSAIEVGGWSRKCARRVHF